MHLLYDVSCVRDSSENPASPNAGQIATDSMPAGEGRPDPELLRRVMPLKKKTPNLKFEVVLLLDFLSILLPEHS
ncbi:MAG: hypothetical protein CMF36_02285 [Leeuwenhoekiella sp.]|nr:hypothetical protein [Leeuwenhoekiella sp.]MBA79943.1 hypothetical protein [Leeuwenhoekiella sp.]